MAAPGIGECASRLETCRNKFEVRYDIAPPPPCKCANFSKRCGPNEDLLRGYCWVDDSNYWWCPECSHYLWEELGTDYGYYVPPHLQYWIADKKEETPMATPSLIFEEELVQTIPSFRPSNAGVRSFPYPEVWLTLMGLAVRARLVREVASRPVAFCPVLRRAVALVEVALRPSKPISAPFSWSAGRGADRAAPHGELAACRAAARAGIRT